MFNTRLIITTENKIYPDSWTELLQSKLTEMVNLGKTDGIRVPTHAKGKYNRFFIDTASAQEYIDWVNSADCPAERVDFEIAAL